MADVTITYNPPLPPGLIIDTRCENHYIQSGGTCVVPEMINECIVRTLLGARRTEYRFLVSQVTGTWYPISRFEYDDGYTLFDALLFTQGIQAFARECLGKPLCTVKPLRSEIAEFLFEEAVEDLDMLDNLTLERKTKDPLDLGSKVANLSFDTLTWEVCRYTADCLEESDSSFAYWAMEKCGVDMQADHPHVDESNRDIYRKCIYDVLLGPNKHSSLSIALDGAARVLWRCTVQPDSSIVSTTAKLCMPVLAQGAVRYDPKFRYLLNHEKLDRSEFKEFVNVMRMGGSVLQVKDNSNCGWFVKKFMGKLTYCVGEELANYLLNIDFQGDFVDALNWVNPEDKPSYAVTERNDDYLIIEAGHDKVGINPTWFMCMSPSLIFREDK